MAEMRPDRLTNPMLRVLLAILEKHPITQREIARRLGWNSMGNSWVGNIVHKLTQRGLIHYTPRVHRSISPRCRFIPVEKL